MSKSLSSVTSFIIVPFISYSIVLMLQLFFSQIDCGVNARINMKYTTKIPYPRYADLVSPLRFTGAPEPRGQQGRLTPCPCYTGAVRGQRNGLPSPSFCPCR